MNAKEYIRAIQELKFTELLAYLRNTGWNRIKIDKESIAIFNKELNGKYFETILPLNKDFKDYQYRILDVINVISKVEQREEQQIVSDLLIPPSDTVRFRVSNKDTIGGTITFLDGFNLLESAKKALYTSACDIIQPEKYHKRLYLNGAEQFIHECRLGQTETGSFIASVICPFVNQSIEDKAIQLSIFNQSEEFRDSFTRKVTLKLMSNLNLIKSSIDNGEENNILELEGKDVISANFLESIVDLNSTMENTEVEVMTNWSSFAQETTINKVVKFTNDYIPVIENLINKLRPYEKGIEDAFIGKVSLTKADPDLHTRTEGEIILNYIMGEEEKVSKAKVILNNHDYELACKAHKEGKSVKIRGRLVTIGRSKLIELPNFEIIG